MNPSFGGDSMIRPRQPAEAQEPAERARGPCDLHVSVDTTGVFCLILLMWTWSLDGPASIGGEYGSIDVHTVIREQKSD